MARRPSKKQTIWVVTERYNLEIWSNSLVCQNTNNGQLEGFDVKFISGHQTYSSPGPQEPQYQDLNGIENYRVWNTHWAANVILYRLVNTLTLWMSILWGSVRRFNQGDKVLVIATPPIIPVAAALASLIKGASYTLLIRDHYPDQLIDMGVIKPNSLSARAMHFANAWVFKYAARIIVVGDELAEHLKARTTGLDLPISAIPFWSGHSVENVVALLNSRHGPLTVGVT